MKKVAVLGFGVIGAGVCKLLTEGTGTAELKYICDLRDIPGLPYGEKHIKDFDIILNDPGDRSRYRGHRRKTRGVRALA